MRPGGPGGNGRTGSDCRGGADYRWVVVGSQRRNRFVGRGYGGWFYYGGDDGQRRRFLGQCEKIYRRGEFRRKRFGRPQSSSGGRYGRRSFQGYLRAFP